MYHNVNEVHLHCDIVIQTVLYHADFHLIITRRINILMKCIFYLFLMTLVGCTSIDQPIAQLQLVRENNGVERQFVSNALWRDFLNESEGHKLNSDGHTVYLGKLYVSATGHICRKLIWENSFPVNVSNLTCKSTLSDSWFFVESVMAEYTGNLDTSGTEK